MLVHPPLEPITSRLKRHEVRNSEGSFPNVLDVLMTSRPKGIPIRGPDIGVGTHLVVLELQTGVRSVHDMTILALLCPESRVVPDER